MGINEKRPWQPRHSWSWSCTERWCVVAAMCTMLLAPLTSSARCPRLFQWRLGCDSHLRSTWYHQLISTLSVLWPTREWNKYLLSTTSVPVDARTYVRLSLPILSLTHYTRRRRNESFPVSKPIWLLPWMGPVWLRCWIGLCNVTVHYQGNMKCHVP